jgi:hypothetical protein
MTPQTVHVRFVDAADIQVAAESTSSTYVCSKE